MKTIVTTLFFALTFLFCEAKPIENQIKTNKVSTVNKIPTYVKKWLDKELANTTTTVLKTFESPAFFTKKNARIIGYIKGYDQTQGAKTGMYYYTNQLTREQKPRVIEIHKDGRFELELPLAYPTQSYFSIKNQVISFYAEPGQNLSVILNWEDIKQPRRISYPLKNVTYQGVLGAINSNLLNYKPDYSSRDFQKKEAIMKPVAFKNYILQFKSDALNKINGYEQSGVIDLKTSELLKNEVLLETYYSLFDYYSPTYSPRYGQGKRKATNIDDTLPEDYYDFIKDLPLDKQSILVNQNFSNFINRLEYAPQLKVKSSVITTSTDFLSEAFLSYLEKNNLKISTEDKTFLQNSIGNIDKNFFNENKERISNFTKKHKVILRKYAEKQSAIAWRKEFIRVKKMKDSIANTLDIKNNLVYEIIQTRQLNYLFKSNIYKDKNWYWNELKKGITSPHLLKVGDDLLERKIDKPEFYTLPKNEKGTKIFNKLIAPYNGKVVVVQFWNPWSYYQGKGLERMKLRRKSFCDNKEVVFLNITNKSDSSLEKYNKSVLKNGFTNSIRIPQDDYHYLRQLFKFNTTVHDLIVAKDGVSIYDYEGMHQLKNILNTKFSIKPIE